MSLYTLIFIASVVNGGWRPVSVVVPNLSYQECNNQIKTLSMGTGIENPVGSCALQSTETK